MISGEKATAVYVVCMVSGEKATAVYVVCMNSGEYEVGVGQGPHRRPHVHAVDAVV
jgi:hypothetical protein